MIQKKVCMLGAFAVGKTSLVRRYIDSIFSEMYVTTLGVKVDKKRLEVSGRELNMLLWDVYGEDIRKKVLPAYLRGMAGYLLVVDPTRPSTINSAVSLNKLVNDTLGHKPFVLVMNKSDLKAEWEVQQSDMQALADMAITVMQTSAKTDTGVDEMFQTLGQALLPTDHPKLKSC